MAINLVNIFDKNCPLRTLEMAFQRIQFSISSGENAPRSPRGSPFQHSPYWKNIPVLHTQKVGQYACDSLGTISTVGEEHRVTSQTAAGNQA